MWEDCGLPFLIPNPNPKNCGEKFVTYKRSLFNKNHKNPVGNFLVICRLGLLIFIFP